MNYRRIDFATSGLQIKLESLSTLMNSNSTKVIVQTFEESTMYNEKYAAANKLVSKIGRAHV